MGTPGGVLMRVHYLYSALLSLSGGAPPVGRAIYAMQFMRWNSLCEQRNEKMSAALCG